MIKKCNKIISLFVVIILLLPFCTNFKVYGNSTTVEELKQKYPNGAQWNGSYYWATQCAGFARLMFDEYYGYNPVTYCAVSYDLNSLKAGDVLRYDGGGAYSGGHEVWVLAVNGNSITVGECNWAGQNIISWGRVMYKSDITNVQHIYVAPYELGTTPPVLQPASNVKAVVNSSSYGVDITWNRDESTSGYLIEIYNATDVENGDFSTPVKTVNIRKNSTTSEKITSLSEGNYYAYVKGKRGNEASLNRGAGAKFYINPITSISLDKTSLGTIVGTTTKLTATINPSNTTDNKTLIWSSNNTSVATVDQEGNVTTLAEGYATITVSTNNSIMAKCSVVVNYTENPIRVVLLDKYNVKLEKGETTVLKASFMPTDATGDKTVTWSSYDESIAKVDSYGKVTAVGVGKTSIAAKSVNGMLITCDIEVTEVTPKPITRITLNLTQKEMEIGETFELVATILPKNTTDDKTITWTSNNENIVKVDKDGVVKAINAGTATITATAGTKTATCTVNVKDLQIIETILKGDVNGDGKITLADCTKILAHVKKTQLLSGDALLAADVNGDGKVTLADYTKVLAYVKNKSLL